METYQLHAHDGQQRTVSLTGGPLRDASGQFVGAVGVFRDVTHVLRLQQALAVTERQYRTLVEHLPDMITRFDPDLRLSHEQPVHARSAIPASGMATSRALRHQ